MGKRTAIFFSGILVLGLLVLGYFLNQNRRVVFTDPYKTVGEDAVFIIETSDLQGFINSITNVSGLQGELMKMKELQPLAARLKYLSDQLGSEEIKRIYGPGPFVISFYDHDSDLKPGLLLSAVLPPKTGWRQVREALIESDLRDARSFEVGSVPALMADYSSEGVKGSVYLTSYGGLFLCATSEQLLLKAITRAEEEQNISDMQSFARLHKATGADEDKIFLFFDKLGISGGRIFAGGAEGRIAKSLQTLASCMSGDLYFKNDGFLMSGYIDAAVEGNFLYRLKEGKADMIRAGRVLPASTIMFETAILDLTASPQVNSGSLTADASGLASALRPYLGQEVTKALLDIRGSDPGKNRITLYELTDRAFAEKLFLDHFQSGNGKTILFKPDDVISIPVYQAGSGSLSAGLAPEFIKGSTDSCFVFHDNYLVTGSSFNTLSVFLYENLLNRTLSNDLNYREFESSLPSVAAYYFYCSPPELLPCLEGFLGGKLLETLNSNIESVSKVRAAGFQMMPSNNMLYSTVSVQYMEEAREESVTEWETLLDTVAAIKPFFFTNHLTGAKEIFIQDLDNNAYLINSAGRVLWKVPLKERIMGQVFMTDYYRNGKNQLLFASENYLHLLDRNGNYVERYPVKLRSPASNPMALFDYDNNRNYRILIAGTDRNIYAYDLEGNIVRGWKNFRCAAPVTAELSWFRVSGKDYLVVADEISVYLLDRTGSVRLTLKEPASKARSSTIRLSQEAQQSIVFSAPDGTVQHVYFDGSVSKISLGSFSEAHSFDFFDIDGDGFGEYIFIDRGMLYLYDHNRTLMFTKDFGQEELGGPINFIFSADRRNIGVYMKEKKLIYLIDKYGIVMDGFPLRGASMFSIGKLTDRNAWNLIVGGTDRFLYNYKLNQDY